MLFKTSLTKELFYTSLATILILSGVVIAQRSVYIFRLAAKGIIPNDAIDTVLVFNLLKHLPLLLSLTIFLTVLITLTRWYRDSEMIIWFSSGLGLINLIKPIIIFSLPIIILIASLSLYISPWAVYKAEQFKKGLKSRDELATITPGMFKESKSDNRIFYVEGFSELGNVVKNIFVQSIQNGKVGVIIANEGERIENKRGEDYIVMKEGRRYEGQSNSQEFSTTYFTEYGVLIEKEARKIISIGEVYEAKSTLELLASDSSRYKAELYWRISLPISALLLVFLAIPLSVINPRSGRSVNIIMALLLFVIYNNLLGVSHSIVSIGNTKIWYGLWPVHLFFATIAFYLLYRRTSNLPLLPKIIYKIK
jgi:lipopolysaccharide export system permease protein